MASDQAKAGSDYGAFLKIVPVVAIAVSWLWMLGMLDFANPERALTWVMVGAVVATAALAYIEADKARDSEYFEMSLASPFGWLVVVALAWPLGYPIYLYQRHHYGHQKMLWAGVVIVAAFLWTAGSLPDAIDRHHAAMAEAVRQYIDSFVRP